MLMSTDYHCVTKQQYTLDREDQSLVQGFATVAKDVYLFLAALPCFFPGQSNNAN